MLEFVFGVSGTGKTHRILEQIKCLAQKSHACIFIVPEQFSTTAETLVYNLIGDELSNYVSVYSFTSFGEHLLNKYGGTSLKTLSDAASVVLVKRAMNEVKDELKVYKSSTKNVNIYSMFAQVFKELKTAGATSEDVLNISKNLGEDGYKFKELALILSAYNTLMLQTALDETDRLNLAAQRLELDYISDKYIFVDNFDGFTSPQYNMLEKLIFAKKMCVSLCCDTLLQNNDETSIFGPVALTARRLKNIAQKHMVEVKAESKCSKNYRHETNANLKVLNKMLCEQMLDKEDEKVISDYNLQSDNCNYNLYFTVSDDNYSEMKNVATQISKLVETGVNYSEIVVICRQLDSYKTPMEYEFNLAEIPFFIDEGQTLEHTAHAYFLRCALQIAYRGLSTQYILQLLKTNICGFDDEHIGALENYAYTWQITAEEWRNPFVKSPSGFGNQSDLSSSDAELLKMAEDIRASAIPKLCDFLASIKNKNLQGSFSAGKCKASSITSALYNLLLSFNADENSIKIASYLQNSGMQLKCENVYKTWNNIMVMLDEMNELLGEDLITAVEYDELFAILLRSYDMGKVPVTQDVVIVTTADRMKLENPKYCFVLGLNDGQFPKTVGYSGILTHADRDKFVENGIDMPGGFEKRTMLEKMYFYRALTAPSHGAYLSAIKQEGCGAPITTEISQITDDFHLRPLQFELEDFCSTPTCALDMLYTLYRKDTPQSAALESVLKLNNLHEKSLHTMKLMQQSKNFTANNKNAIKSIIGKNLMLSPTKIEKYYKCKFSYFLQYVLKIKPRQKAQLSPLETGSIVHYILENALRKAADDFVNLSFSQLESLANETAELYVKENMPGITQRLEYLVQRLKSSSVNLLKFLQDEQKQSSFYPAGFEMSIGYDKGAIKPLMLKTPTGETVTVVGKIDRVDVMKRQDVNYIRVVDYKTGDKNFRLDNVFCGIDIQMLFYLFTICNTKNSIFENALPAGALYIQADSAVFTASRNAAKVPPTYKVDGIILDDEVVLRGMDKDLSGLFVPFSFSKNGAALRAGDKIASFEKLGNIKNHIEDIIVQMAKGLYDGEIDATALCTNSNKPCDYCDYRAVCRHEDGVNEKIISAPKNVFDPLAE